MNTVTVPARVDALRLKALGPTTPAGALAMQELLRGERGAPGPQGVGGVQHIHTQTAPMAVWTVPHNLHRYPVVVVTDTLGAVVVADVAYVDTSVVRITHGSAFSGVAYCS